MRRAALGRAALGDASAETGRRDERRGSVMGSSRSGMAAGAGRADHATGEDDSDQDG